MYIVNNRKFSISSCVLIAAFLSALAFWGLQLALISKAARFKVTHPDGKPEKRS